MTWAFEILFFFPELIMGVPGDPPKVVGALLWAAHQGPGIGRCRGCHVTSSRRDDGWKILEIIQWPGKYILILAHVFACFC